ncbi:MULTISPECIES: ArsS family sensor histidine kinase [Helicobacter]|uniref:histidine kinase n=1 Tax=Helicobacter ibis TaxID=2962633 RepID=A0ABT4VER1_9HELI|nr:MULTISPECIES: ArsS family sensor histidine kinase [Helicobacter]MDA3967045.1 ArsS family sensor histidine kinase [Helicobacter sp. WB40]MDA3969179.1 ArsS family sensor histidine kinase [Helicobacter ibis]
MFKTSIFIKITILFVVAIFFLGASSYYFIREEINNEMLNNQLKYNQFLATINQLVRFGGNIDLIEKYLHELDLNEINDSDILRKFSHHLANNLEYGVYAKIIKDDHAVYLLLQTPTSWSLYGDFHTTKLLNYYILTFVGFFVVVFLFGLVIKSILPLKILRREIRKFANGDTNISIPIKQYDEIGEVADEFNHAVEKINALNNSRKLFLRAIMHELKTPITKGRITAEMLEDSVYKDRLCSVFIRLNSLIDEFANIEKLSSKNHALNKHSYYLSEILDKVFSMLLLDSQQVREYFILPEDEYLLYVDFEMISLAVKNLLDNALKYKTHGRVEIIVNDRDVLIKNYGIELKGDFKDYSKPFFKQDSNPSGGFGLGIYIVNSTLESQELKLEYKHSNGYNIFTIKQVVQNFCRKEKDV